jgi:hypothetical protein
MKKIILFLIFATSIAFAQTPTEQRILANSTDVTVIGLAGQTLLNNNILEPTSTAAATDLQGKYRSLNVTIKTTGTPSSGQIIFEGCNELNGTYLSIFYDDVTSGIALINNATGAFGLAANSTKQYKLNTRFQFVKCRISTVVVGATIQAITKFSPFEQNPFLQRVVSPTASELNATVVQSGTWTFAPITTPVATTTGDTGAKTVTFAGVTITNANAKGALILFNISAATGTAPTLVCKIQESADGGSTWIDMPNATTATITTAGTYGLKIYPSVTPITPVATSGTVAQVSSTLGRTWRVFYTIGGTTPSITLTTVQVLYIL